LNRKPETRCWKISIFLATLMVVRASIGLQGQTAAPQPPPLMLGTAWYPEQWPETRWEADLALM